MHIETFPVGVLQCNCSIVVDPATKKAIVVDPGGDFEKIRERLGALGAEVAAIVHTHTHIDHVGATAPLQRLTDASAKIHEADRFLYDLAQVQAEFIGIPRIEMAEMDGDLTDDLVVEAGAVRLRVMHTPGHSPGSVTFVLDEQNVAFTGDTLFRRGIGRTDLWGGDGDLILRSLRDRVLSLGDDVRVVSGHGVDSTIGEERRNNRFLRAL